MEKWVKTEKKLPTPHEMVEVRFVQHNPGTKTVSCLYEGLAYFREVPENRRGASSGWGFHQRFAAKR